MAVCDGAIPDVMVAFAAPLERAAILQKNTADFLFIFSHYKTILSRRSDVKTRERGKVFE